MINMEGLVIKLERLGYKVRYQKQSGKYTITGIGYANFGSAASAKSTAEQLAGETAQEANRSLSEARKASRQAKTPLSPKQAAQRAKASASRVALSKLDPSVKEAYQNIRKQWKEAGKEVKKAFKRRHPGFKHIPDATLWAKEDPITAMANIEDLSREMKGDVSKSELSNMKDLIWKQARNYNLDESEVMKMLDEDKEVSYEQFDTLRDVLIDSDNPAFYARQADPKQAFVDAIEKFKSVMKEE